MTKFVLRIYQSISSVINVIMIYDFLRLLFVTSLLVGTKKFDSFMEHLKKNSHLFRGSVTKCSDFVINRDRQFERGDAMTQTCSRAIFF